MKIEVKEYLRSRSESYEYAVRHASRLNLNIALVLSAVTGEFYTQHASYIDLIPAEDIVICQFIEREEASEDEALPGKLLLKAEGLIDTDEVEKNQKKGKLIYMYEFELYGSGRMTEAQTSGIETVVRFTGPITQVQLDNAYKIAKDYMTARKTNEAAKRLIFDIEVVNRPGNVIKPDEERDYCTCPNCGHQLTGSEYSLFGEHNGKNFCENCGQKLVWT